MWLSSSGCQDLKKKKGVSQNLVYLRGKTISVSVEGGKSLVVNETGVQSCNFK